MLHLSCSPAGQQARRGACSPLPTALGSSKAHLRDRFCTQALDRAAIPWPSQGKHSMGQPWCRSTTRRGPRHRPHCKAALATSLLFTFEFGHGTQDQLARLQEALNCPLQLRGNRLWDRGLRRLAAEGKQPERSSEPSSQPAREGNGETPLQQQNSGSCAPAVGTGTQSLTGVQWPLVQTTSREISNTKPPPPQLLLLGHPQRSQTSVREDSGAQPVSYLLRVLPTSWKRENTRSAPVLPRMTTAPGAVSYGRSPPA